MSNEAASFELGAVIKGAIVGGVASLIGSVVVAFPFMSGTPRSEAEAEAMATALASSQAYLLTDLVASLLFMAIGGYVAAASAGHSGGKHGAITGALLMLVVGAMFMMSSTPTPGWYSAAIFSLIIPAAALGGVLRRA